MEDDYKNAIDQAVRQALDKNLDEALERAMKQMMKNTAQKAWRFARKAAFVIAFIVLWFCAGIWFPAGGDGSWILSAIAAVLLLSLLAAADAISHHANAAGHDTKRFSLSWMLPYLVALAGYAGALLLANFAAMSSVAAALASLSLAFPALLPFIRGLWHHDVVEQLRQAYVEEAEIVPEVIVAAADSDATLPEVLEEVAEVE